MEAADALPVWDALIARRRRLRHRALRHPRDGHGARRGGALHARRRLHRGHARVDRGPEILALRDGPRLDHRARQARLLRRPARARARGARGLGLEDGRPRGRLGRPRAPLRRRRPAAADPGHGGARQPAGAEGRPAGGLRLDEHVVAGAQEVHRAGAPAAAALRAGHAGRAWRSRSSTTAGTPRARWSRCRSTSPSGSASDRRRHATTRSSSARATTA